MSEQQQETRERRRVTYTPKLECQLMQLCVQHGTRYLETVPEENFWSYIHSSFVPISRSNSGDGGTIRKKVAAIVGKREKEIDARKQQSGVAIAAPTDFEQATDAWIEFIARRKEERETARKEKAALQRLNLTKTLSEKRTFQEVSAIDLTETESTRDKRRRTGQAWASGKEKETQDRWDRMERQDQETSGLIRDILSVITTSFTSSSSSTGLTISITSGTSSTVSITAGAAASSSITPARSSTPPTSPSITPQTPSITEARFARLENQIGEIRETQTEILRLLSEMRRDKSEMRGDK